MVPLAVDDSENALRVNGSDGDKGHTWTSLPEFLLGACDEECRTRRGVRATRNDPSEREGAAGDIAKRRIRELACRYVQQMIVRASEDDNARAAEVG